MMQIFDLVLKNGRVVTPDGIVETDIAVTDGKIAAFGKNFRGLDVIDCKNLHILPGVIDSHVHFREPGLTHKEDLSTGTLAALAGGVTTIFEMPNTDPLTITGAALQDKVARAKGRAFCDHAFYIGGCANNAEYLQDLERLSGCSGVKIFMGSSTGALLAAEDDVIFKIFQHGTRPVTIHAEDENRLIERKPLAKNVADHPVWRDEETALLAVKRAVSLARKASRRVHFLHVTSAGEMVYLKDCKDIATVETTPQHLTLSAEDCYDRLGTRAQMNPPIRAATHRDALWRAIADGTIDTLGSDHAPHTLDEKKKPYPQSPSGMPGVQTILPVMLNHVAAGKLSLEKLVDLLCHNPQRVFQIHGKGRIETGYDADFAIVDLNAKRTITDQWIKSKCGWTPYDGMQVTGWVKGTILRGAPVMWEDEMLVAHPFGRPVTFDGFAAMNFEDAADAPHDPAVKACC